MRENIAVLGGATNCSPREHRNTKGPAMTTFLARLDLDKCCFHVDKVSCPAGQSGWVALAPELAVISWNGRDGIPQIIPIVGRDDLCLFRLATPLVVAEKPLEVWWVEDGRSGWMRYLVFGLVHALQERSPRTWAGEIPVLVGAPLLSVQAAGGE